MANRLAWYFRAKRQRQGLTVEALAAKLGYRNIRKGCRRILRFEQEGQCSDNFLVNLTDALGIDCHTVLDLSIRDATSSPEVTFWQDKLVSGQFCFRQAVRFRTDACARGDIRFSDA